MVKGVESPERLLDETALFLHRVEADLPERKQRVLRRLAKTDPQLASRTVLAVDDDLRNIFDRAITTETSQAKSIHCSTADFIIERTCRI